MKDIRKGNALSGLKKIVFPEIEKSKFDYSLRLKLQLGVQKACQLQIILLTRLDVLCNFTGVKTLNATIYFIYEECTKSNWTRIWKCMLVTLILMRCSRCSFD